MDEEPAGHKPSSPEFGPEQLKDAEESAVGQPTSSSSSSTAPGKINYSTGQPKPSSPSNLSSNTAPGKLGYTNDVPDEEKSLYTSSSTAPGKVRFKGLLATRRRKTIFGGGVVGTIAGLIIMFSVASGPLQFIHLSQRLQEIHFAGLQDQQDNRFLHEVRYIRYASKGQVERSRLGLLGNKFADSFEAKLNAGGYVSAYSSRSGLFDGYVIDQSKGSRFHGMSEEDIKATVKAETGLDVVRGETVRGGKLNGKLVISAKGLGLFKTRALTRTVLDNAGYSKLSQAIGARIMCARAGCSLHPLKILGQKTQSALEDWWNKRAKADENGEQSYKTKAEQKKVDKKNQSLEEAAQQGVNDTNAGVDNALKDPSKIGDLTGTIKGNLLKGAAGVGVLCMVRQLNGEYGTLKQTQVVLPLVRLGTEMVALGSEIQTGQDVNLDELSKYSQNLYGKDSTGGNSGVFDAASFRAADGQTGGVPADQTLKGIGAGSPFSFIKSVPGLGAACSTVGGIFGGIITIGLDATGIGGVAAALANGVLSSIVIGQASSDLAHWLVGKAVDVNNLVGGDYGNYINYGAHLAANMEGILAGGLALLPGQAAQLQNYENYAASQDFASHSLAYRLFNPYDDHSAISRLINNSSPSPSANFAKMGSALLNVGHSFGSLGSLLFGHAKAATTAYDYGFPTYGFSVQDMNNAPDNPYQNACELFSCAGDGAYHGAINGSLADLNGNQTNEGKSLIPLAEACFQVNISNDSGYWDVTGNDSANNNSFPSYEKINSDGHGCTSNDPNWLKLRFFIMDTETMNAMACYQGSDSDAAVAQACSDVGFTTANPTTAGGSGGGGGGGSGANASVVWPFATKSTGQYQRIDQGWDLQDLGGAAVYAIASGTLHVYNPNPGGFGNDYPTEELDSSIGGPTQWVYYGHVHIIASLNGKHVKAGQLIAHANTTDPQNGSAAPAGWLEIGFARPDTDAPVDPGSESVVTQAGQQMHDILIKVSPAGSGQ